METTTLTLGSDRSFVRPPTTGQLNKVVQMFEIPTNPAELLILWGAKRELEKRENEEYIQRGFIGTTREELEKEVEDLNEQLDGDLEKKLSTIF